MNAYDKAQIKKIFDLLLANAKKNGEKINPQHEHALLLSDIFDALSLTDKHELKALMFELVAHAYHPSVRVGSVRIEGDALFYDITQQ